MKLKRGYKMTSKTKPREHIKVYADAHWLRLIKSAAKDEGLTQSGYLFMCFVESQKKRNRKK
jgi:hypothetical protein